MRDAGCEVHYHYGMQKLTPLLAALLPGCIAAVAAVLVVGAVAVGTYSYANNVLSRSYDAPIDACWEGTKRALRHMNLPTQGEPKCDFQRGEHRVSMADNRYAVVSLERLAEKSTKISVRVSDFESQANRDAAQRIHEEIYHQLTGKVERDAPPAPPSNSMREEYPADYDRAWNVSLSAVKHLGFTDVAPARDALKGTIRCKRADGTPVEVIVARLDKAVSVDVRVGTERSDENARAARALHAELKKELGGR